ncbi:hypothetical protein GCM10011390_50220 [Aureimonas endophytica]|uniref:Uncharacterized protein n=1 Tax=Aureimonas endophytica TaxID=2027858 RepID=A0A917A3C8_9HYPH|nr:hypothetical protein [Aureimonas endophytica]GGE24753.1 hypothetical protein GCM10011390_50220 [Aureimonas endophytica]
MSVDPVQEAAQWLAGLTAAEKPSPIIPELRRRFGLSALEACRVTAAAGKMTTAPEAKL